ncbi:hypothetical protein ACYOEI_11280 [Singulisphaera rosea]
MTRIRREGLWVVLAVVAMAPTVAEARWYGRSSGLMNTPYGAVNMNSPEWRASGGNIFTYQQLMEEKMMMQQQQMMLKQQQQYQKMMQQAAKKKKDKAEVAPDSNITSLTPPVAKKKKRKGVATKASVSKARASTPSQSRTTSTAP